MKLRHLYLILCIIGAALPYYEFISFLLENGLDFELFYKQLSASRISGFFALDVVVSAVVLLVFVFVEGKHQGVRNLWLPVIATLAVGVSLGLPLFLYMRQEQMDKIS